jgi:hypothetical protein
MIVGFTSTCKVYTKTGADPGFQDRGGTHLKKLRRAEAGAKIVGVFRVKNHDFTPKNHIFTNLRGGGGAACAPWIRPCKRHSTSTCNVYPKRHSIYTCSVCLKGYSKSTCRVYPKGYITSTCKVYTKGHSASTCKVDPKRHSIFTCRVCPKGYSTSTCMVAYLTVIWSLDVHLPEMFILRDVIHLTVREWFVQTVFLDHNIIIW